MLAKRGPAKPVAAEEEDRAETDGEIPVLRRRKTGDKGARVVGDDRASGLTGERRQRRQRGGHDRGQPEEGRRDSRDQTWRARLCKQRRLDDRGARDEGGAP